MLYQQGANMGSNMGPRMHSYPLYQDLQARAEPFSEVMCRRLVPASVAVDNQTECVQAELNLEAADTGVALDNLVMFHLAPPLDGYDNARPAQLYGALLDRIQSAPGVKSAGLASVPILSGDEWDSSTSVEGHHPVDGEDMQAFMNAVSPGYFQTLWSSLAISASPRNTRRSKQPLDSLVGTAHDACVHRKTGENERSGELMTRSAAAEWGRCPCGGQYEHRLIEVNVTVEGTRVTLTDVPQGACPNCGSRVYKAEMLARIESIMKGETLDRKLSWQWD